MLHEWSVENTGEQRHLLSYSSAISIMRSAMRSLLSCVFVTSQGKNVSGNPVLEQTMTIGDRKPCEQISCNSSDCKCCVTWASVQCTAQLAGLKISFKIWKHKVWANIASVLHTYVRLSPDLVVKALWALGCVHYKSPRCQPHDIIPRLSHPSLPANSRHSLHSQALAANLNPVKTSDWE